MGSTPSLVLQAGCRGAQAEDQMPLSFNRRSIFGKPIKIFAAAMINDDKQALIIY
jgi:hypothetical protein